MNSHPLPFSHPCTHPKGLKTLNNSRGCEGVKMKLSPCKRERVKTMMLTLPHQRDGFGASDALGCPDCGQPYMHHGRVEVFTRGEDAGHVTMTVIEDGRPQVARVPNASSGNPSLRRDGVRIFLTCERCSGSGADKVLCIEQHKGCTFLSWGPSPSLDPLFPRCAHPFALAPLIR